MQINYTRAALLHDTGPMVTVQMAFDALQKAVEAARHQAQSKEAVDCLREMDEALADVRHDCSLAYVVDRCATGGL